MTKKTPAPHKTKKRAKVAHPGMMGDVAVFLTTFTLRPAVLFTIVLNHVRFWG